MANRKRILNNLIDNSIAAYFAAVEIHNKPNIKYRYETSSLLFINAWELILKAFIRKYIKSKSIFENKDKKEHTIAFEKAVTFVNDYLNSKKTNSFTAIKENLIMINNYRNNIAHFYHEPIEPQIFSLIARCALNYVEFVKTHFSIDIFADERLFIMPLGFKLPFKPQDFLSKETADYVCSEEAKRFINNIIKITEDLNSQNIEDSIVLGFDIYLESVKKVTNSDFLVAITSKEEADVKFAKTTKVQFTNDPNAQKVFLTDDIISDNLLSYKEVVDICKEEIKEFKQNPTFNEIMKKLKEKPNLCFHRKYNPKSKKSGVVTYYSPSIIDEIKKEYVGRSFFDA